MFTSDDPHATLEIDLVQAASVLSELAAVYSPDFNSAKVAAMNPEGPHLGARYKALVEQIPAVVFMAYLDRGIGEAYISPQIEAELGFSRDEWLEDPVRWYRQIH